MCSSDLSRICNGRLRQLRKGIGHRTLSGVHRTVRCARRQKARIAFQTRTGLKDTLRGHYHFHLTRTDTESHCSHRPVGGSMRVTADNGHARQGQPAFRTYYLSLIHIYCCRITAPGIASRNSFALAMEPAIPASPSVSTISAPISSIQAIIII